MFASCCRCLQPVVDNGADEDLDHRDQTTDAQESSAFVDGEHKMDDDSRDQEVRRRFQVRLGEDWKDLSEEEHNQIWTGLRKGDAIIDMQSRGQMYTIDLTRMVQVALTTGRMRDIRELQSEEQRAMHQSGDGIKQVEFISKRQGLEWDPFASEQPDWRWEVEGGRWNSYPLHESIELDRYWNAFRSAESREGGAHCAKVRLLKKEALVNFVDMTAQVEGARPRRIERRTQVDDWLSNSYFVEAWRAALKRAGVEFDSKPTEVFDFQFSQDFRSLRDDGRELTRGGQRYKLPVGWKRFAVKVRGKYDEGDNTWLREDDTGWAVAYHGTQPEGLPGILSTGFRVGERQKFEDVTGKGVYCAPDVQVAQHYSTPQELEGRSVQIVLQLRVRPSAIRRVTDASAHEFERKYWVINNPSDIRAYGVLIRELPIRQFVPALMVVYGWDNPECKKLWAELIAGK